MKDEQKGIDSVIVEPNKVEISMQMLACGEAVKFKGLADMPGHKSEPAISIKFRIAETINDGVKRLPTDTLLIRAIIYTLCAVGLAFFGVLEVIRGDADSPSFHYVMRHEGRQIRNVELKPVAEERVALGHYVPSEQPWWRVFGGGANGQVHFEVLRLLSVNELFRTDKVPISVGQSEAASGKARYVVLGTFLIFASVLGISAFRRFREHRLLRRAVPKQET
jgi:hypothetical protein